MAIPQNLQMPVEGAGHRDYNPQSFWYYPWGKSGVHHGIDIFAEKGRTVHSATLGLVVFAGELPLGGKVVLVLGPKWRLHYYAHLNSYEVVLFEPVNHSSVIGSVGNTGNALGKPPHLHFSICSMVPMPWRWDSSAYGWQKMFYLNPMDYWK